MAVIRCLLFVLCLLFSSLAANRPEREKTRNLFGYKPLRQNIKQTVSEQNHVASLAASDDVAGGSEFVFSQCFILTGTNDAPFLNKVIQAQDKKIKGGDKLQFDIMQMRPDQNLFGSFFTEQPYSVATFEGLSVPSSSSNPSSESAWTQSQIWKEHCSSWVSYRMKLVTGTEESVLPSLDLARRWHFVFYQISDKILRSIRTFLFYWQKKEDKLLSHWTLYKLQSLKKNNLDWDDYTQKRPSFHLRVVFSPEFRTEVAHDVEAFLGELKTKGKPSLNFWAFSGISSVFAFNTCVSRYQDYCSYVANALLLESLHKRRQFDVMQLYKKSSFESFESFEKSPLVEDYALATYEHVLDYDHFKQAHRNEGFCKFGKTTFMFEVPQFTFESSQGKHHPVPAQLERLHVSFCGALPENLKSWRASILSDIQEFRLHEIVEVPPTETASQQNPLTPTFHLRIVFDTTLRPQVLKQFISFWQEFKKNCHTQEFLGFDTVV